MAGKRFSGLLRLAPVNAAGVVLGGFIGTLNPVKAEIQLPAPEQIDQISNKIGSEGQVLSSAQISKPANLAISTDDTSDQQVLAYALNGMTASYTQAANKIAVQAGSTVTDEAINAGTLGTPVALAKHHVSELVLTNTAGDTTYVADTDYTVNAALGTVTAKVGGAITANQALKADYTYATTTAETIVAPARLGDWVPLANRGVSNLVITNSAADHTYTNGVDFNYEALSGFVQPLPGGAITAGQSLRASYTAAAITGTTVRGSSVPANLLRVEIELKNLADTNRSRFVCPIYQAGASGNQDLFGKNMLVAALTGRMILPPDGTAAQTETGAAAYTLTGFDP